MRQVFTSQRLETVEGVARMLQEAGIAVHVSQPRSYRGRRSGQFSYSEPAPANQQPAVWVRLAEDQPRARELLREAGLMVSTRGHSGLAHADAGTGSASPEPGRGRWAWRIRIGLMLAIAAVAALLWLGRRPTAADAPPVAVPAPAAQPASTDGEDGDEVIRVRITPPPAGPAD